MKKTKLIEQNEQLKELLKLIKDSCRMQRRFWGKGKNKKQLMKDFLTVYHAINNKEHELKIVL